MLSPSRAVLTSLMVVLIGSASAEATDMFGGGPLELQAGGFVIVAPKYEGSKDYEVIGAPLVAPAGSSDTGFIQFRGPDDVRIRLLNFNGFEAGPVVGWRFDRDESDSARLAGLGDIDGGVVVGGFATYNFGTFKPFVSYNHQVSGDETGGLLRFGAETPLTFGAIKVTALAGATWADDDYMDAYFTVAAPTLILPAYDADSGVKDVFVGFNADVPLSAHWSLKVMVQYSHLIGDAADSPIVEDESQFVGGLGLTYRFNLGP